VSLIEQVEEALDALASAPTAEFVRSRLVAGVDINELEALACLRHCLETSDPDLVAMAMTDDVQLIGKWHRARGREEVLAALMERAQARAAEKKRRVESGFAGKADDDDRGPALRTLIHFVDGRVSGFALSGLDERNTRTSGSFHLEVGNDLSGGERSTQGRIQTISWLHFENMVSGHAGFASMSCVPSAEVLDLVTGFDVLAAAGHEGRIAFSIVTGTDRFECELRRGDALRLSLWANAVAWGVDHCGTDLWQRCKMELCAHLVAPGWVTLVVRSARAWERADLIALVSVHDLVSRLRRAFNRLAAEIALDPGLWSDICLIDVAPELEDDGSSHLTKLHHLATRELFCDLAQRLAELHQPKSKLEAPQLRMREVLFDSATVQRLERALALPGNYDLLTADERLAVLCSRSNVVLQAPMAEPLDRLAWPEVAMPVHWKSSRPGR
jgi:hypothetical protein